MSYKRKLKKKVGKSKMMRFTSSEGQEPFDEMKEFKSFGPTFWASIGEEVEIRR